MGDHENGDARLMKLRENPVHVRRRLGIKPRDWLVEEQELSRRPQRSREENSLLLAAREVAVAAFCQGENAEPLHIFFRQIFF